jgi:hypothetical protein
MTKVGVSFRLKGFAKCGINTWTKVSRLAGTGRAALFSGRSYRGLFRTEAGSSSVKVNTCAG